MMEQEAWDRFKDSLSQIPKALEPFIEAFGRLTELLKQFQFVWAWHTGSTSAHRYALAGYPFGRHTKGKKRWLREMKARHRQ